jgi:hypothetical protein
LGAFAGAVSPRVVSNDRAVCDDATSRGAVAGVLQVVCPSRLTVRQLVGSLRLSGAPTDYFSYAYCIFCSHEDFDRHHKETGEPGNYDSMRAEVAEAHFGGDTSFDAGTAIETGSSHQDSVGGGIGGSESPSDSGSVGDSGGGGSGGDGGGGGGD